MLDDDAIEVREEDLASLTTTRAAGEERDEGGAPFRIADDLFDRVGGTESRGTFLTDDADDTWGQPPEELSGAKFDFRDEEAAVGDGGAPIIDRDDEVPDRFWDPEVAGLGRRAGALLVDQALLALLVGGFFLGALAAFRLSGFDTDLFLAPPGLRAAALPFALLAALLSFACHAFFHGYALRTPGKALAGIEVRTAAGEQPAWSRVVLRWCGAALGLGAAGVGWAWALFDPRRRGWADLLSGTVVALRRPAGAPRR